MNAKLLDWELNDRYDRSEGRLFLTGTQALVKLPLLQREIDRRANLNTAGFISGYRGSPLGNYDAALWAAKTQLAAADIVFHPGINEDLAATAVLGSQQANVLPVGARTDGVFAIWYGKGPGVDRSVDALKHGNMYGTSAHGGVLVLAGDDHGGKSSTVAHQSDQALMAAGIPVLHPAGLADYLPLGLFGWAMSRATGVWAGFKCVTEIVESSGTVDFTFPTFVVPDGLIDPVHRAPTPTLMVAAEEDAFYNYRLPAVSAFARANRIDAVVIDPPVKKLGIVSVGKAHGDVVQALADLVVDNVGLYVVRMSWPLEADGLRAFASGYEEILIIEEKRAFVEPQVKDALYHLATSRRPLVSGKADPRGRPLMRESGDLSPSIVRAAIVHRMGDLGMIDEALATRIAYLDTREQAASGATAAVAIRTPAFCSGCPHNRSTKIPDGSYALGGIGCHTMAVYMPDRPTGRPTQMGGEGANWIGMSPFAERNHIFQNLGDGTYFHSGIVAVRATVAAKVNITYKILFNDAVAMTGGQPIDGEQSVAGVARQLLAEGVSPVVVITDDVTRYPAEALPAGVELFDRSALMAIELRLRDIAGTSAIIYDQVCAAEKRRRRKKGTSPDPAKHYFINPAVCEGCGDCGVQSNCVSLTPEPTIFGVKRRINQSSCNKDYSCVEGFCPSFVTVIGGKLRKPLPEPAASPAVVLDPVLPNIDGTYDILVGGIGGTGVVTIGAIIGMAAHLSGKAVSLLDLTGLSQKNGAVASHVRLANDQSALGATRIGIGKADALIACDLLVSASRDVAKCLTTETKVVLNTHFVPVAGFQQARDLPHGTDAAIALLTQTTGYAGDGFDAASAAEAQFGNAVLANMIMLGAAWQKGLIPLSRIALERAITLNGVAVDSNLSAFAAGRRMTGALSAEEQKLPPLESFNAVLKAHIDHLTAYQNAAYAKRYAAFVHNVAAREDAISSGSDRLAIAVARSLGKLMAYKDEYEVARLHRTVLRDAVSAQFTGNYRIRYNLAPPIFSRRDAVSGQLRKREFGAWISGVFAVLAPMKRLRGTVFDPFGWQVERRRERTLAGEYCATVEYLLTDLSANTLDRAINIVSLADDIRGFGHVKAGAIDAYAVRLAEALSK